MKDGSELVNVNACHTCSTCPAAMWCMTDRAWLVLCGLCGRYTQVRQKDDRVNMFGETIAFKEFPIHRHSVRNIIQEFNLGRGTWHLWKVNRIALLGFPIEEIPNFKECRLRLEDKKDNFFPGRDVCDVCAHHIDEAFASSPGAVGLDVKYFTTEGCAHTLKPLTIIPIMTICTGKQLSNDDVD